MSIVDKKFKEEVGDESMWAGDKPDATLKTAVNPISSKDAINEEDTAPPLGIKTIFGRRRKNKKENNPSEPTIDTKETKANEPFQETRGKTTLGKTKFPEYVFHSIEDTQNLSMSKYFLLHVIFIALIVVASNGFRSDPYDYCNNIVAHELTDTYFPTSLGYRKKFKDILRIQEIWEFVRGLFLKIVYSQERNLQKSNRLFTSDNKAAGIVQIRQAKVRSGKCSTAEMFEDMYINCYDYYSVNTEETRLLREGSSVWKYVYDDDKALWTGEFSTYGKGGYAFNLSRDNFFTTHWLNNLVNDAWMDKQTRAVFIDSSMYSPNVNIICAIKLTFEVLPCGTVVPSSYFYSGELFGYLSPKDFFILSCEFAFAGLTVHLIATIIYNAYYLRKRFFYSWPNMLDLTVASLAVTMIILDKILVTYLYGKGRDLADNLNEIHVSFDKILILDFHYRTIVSLLIVASSFKLLTFAFLNKYSNFICTSFVRIKYELAALTSMILIVTVGFSLLSNVLFGHVSKNFSTFSDSIFSLFSIFSDAFNFAEFFLLQYTINGAYEFFLVYFLLVKLSAIGAFIALIVYGFYKTSEDMTTIMERVYFEDAAIYGLMAFLVCIGKRRLADKVKISREIARNKAKYDALTRIMNTRGWNKLEIRLLMNNHRLKRGDKLNDETMNEIYNDFCLRNQLLLEVGAHIQLMTDLEQVQRSIEYCSSIIDDVSSKTVILADVILTSRK